jgi:hypothetical protein
MTDLTRKKKFAQKKTFSIAAETVNFGDVSGAGAHELFVLPANCLITKARIITTVAGQTNLTVGLGFSGSQTALISAGDIDNTGVVIDAGINVQTGTGKVITALFSAAPTAGSFTFIVEFIEFTKAEGDLLNFNA